MSEPEIQNEDTEVEMTEEIAQPALVEHAQGLLGGAALRRDLGAQRRGVEGRAENAAAFAHNTF